MRVASALNEPSMTIAHAVPWYIHPAVAPRQWAGLSRILGGDDFVVVNPHNGPGDRADPYYPAAIAALDPQRVVGYVDLDYGRRSPSAVRDDVLHWSKWYGVRSIMYDQVPSDPASSDLIRVLTGLARCTGARTVIGNPGTTVPHAILKCFDIACTAEMSADTYLRTWLPTAPSEGCELWHLIHSCPAHLRPEVVDKAANLGVRYLHVTSQTLPNPWQGWDDQVPRHR